MFFTDLFNELFASDPLTIHRFQVFQAMPGKIEFRIERSAPPDKEFVAALEEGLRKFFDEVEVVTMSVLPTDKSGKFRYILSDQNR